MAEAPPPVGKRTNARAILAGIVVYALVKMVGVGVMTGVGPFEIAAAPELFGPAALSRAASEVLGCGLIFMLVTGFARITPRSAFLMVALVQAALGWWAPTSMQDTWMQWLFGASGLDRAWEWAGLSPPFQTETSLWGGLSMPELICAAAAGALGQTVHNMAAKPGGETPFQSRA